MFCNLCSAVGKIITTYYTHSCVTINKHSFRSYYRHFKVFFTFCSLRIDATVYAKASKVDYAKSMGILIAKLAHYKALINIILLSRRIFLDKICF